MYINTIIRNPYPVVGDIIKAYNRWDDILPRFIAKCISERSSLQKKRYNNINYMQQTWTLEVIDPLNSRYEIGSHITRWTVWTKCT